MSPVRIGGGVVPDHPPHVKVLLKKETLHCVNPLGVVLKLALEVIIKVQVVLVNTPEIKKELVRNVS
ncbi:hypothetical protein DPMN_026784 [Dreissena polymorpha]|uniref:Uncharacterized protein n=1 Tax=Dreissena polymorpha TaxID=45954 RepID=A0A9D4LU24_DREPO|nr:hypothetical protein DPMN_026784 [Dreissena polymorpha]